MTTKANETERTYVNILTEVYIDQELNTRAIEESQEDLETLAAQIETTGGLLQGIGLCVTPKEHSTQHQFPYELVYGYRRCAALNLLAEQTGDQSWVENVKADIMPAEDYEQRHVAQLIENLGRRDLSPMECALAFQQVLDDPHTTMSQSDLAKKIGWKPATMSNYLKVARTLNSKVKAKVLEGKLSWSSAKVLAGFNLPEDQQDQLALIGQDMEVKEFEKLLQEHTGTAPAAQDETQSEVSTGNADAGTTAEGEAATEGSSTQKPPQSVRGAVLRTKYIPHIEEQLKAAKDEREKLIQATRIDALKYAAGEQGTQLGKDLAPWEEQLEEQAAEEKTLAEQNRLKTVFVRKAVGAITKMLTETPDIHAADRRLPTIGEALAAIKEQVKKDIAAAKEAKLWVDGETPLMQEGFPVADVDAFVAEISTAFEDAAKKKAESAKKRAEAAALRKQQEEAEELKKQQEEAGKPADAEAAPAETAAAAI